MQHVTCLFSAAFMGGVLLASSGCACIQCQCFGTSGTRIVCGNGFGGVGGATNFCNSDESPECKTYSTQPCANISQCESNPIRHPNLSPIPDPGI
jgi:hypothetical protein